MFLINSSSVSDPKLNLAIEEFVVRNFDTEKEYLFIYQNDPSVILGKNQNPFEEINLSYIIKNKIELLRRISGGGAVYHGPGNINFCYITKSTKENFNNYKNFLKPIVAYLNSLDVQVNINSRNDLVIGEKKISGNAQFTSRQRMLCHGTLLFNADLDMINNSLQSTSTSLKSKSTKSVRSKVTNISDYLGSNISLEKFTEKLSDNILNHFSFEGQIDFNQEQWSEINNLAKEKYASWEWTWGRTPYFKLDVTFEGLGKSNFELHIEKGLIKNINSLVTDSFTNSLNNLIGAKYQRKDIELILNKSFDEREKKLIADCLFPF